MTAPQAAHAGAPVPRSRAGIRPSPFAQSVGDPDTPTERAGTGRNGGTTDGARERATTAPQGGGAGDGALPTSSLPVYGVTNGNGSRATVAELGDVNGDGIGDYAVGLPSADVGGVADSGIVYVFLGRAGALPPTPTALDLAAASFTISGHAGEMLGFSIAGLDANKDGLNDIAIGAPMAGAPSKSGGGAVYVIFGSHNPVSVSTSS